jgi:hypothetical protein
LITPPPIHPASLPFIGPTRWVGKPKTQKTSNSSNLVTGSPARPIFVCVCRCLSDGNPQLLQHQQQQPIWGGAQQFDVGCLAERPVVHTYLNELHLCSNSSDNDESHDDGDMPSIPYSPKTSM